MACDPVEPIAVAMGGLAETPTERVFDATRQARGL